MYYNDYVIVDYNVLQIRSTPEIYKYGPPLRSHLSSIVSTQYHPSPASFAFGSSRQWLCQAPSVDLEQLSPA